MFPWDSDDAKDWPGEFSSRGGGWGGWTTIEEELAGINEGGRVLGSGILFRLKTTKCIATLNSSNVNAPSLVTSDNCLVIYKNI